MDSIYVKETIAKAREMGSDIIVCLPHWGEEYMLTPSAQQKRWAAMLLREGADIIIGSHPHVPQSAEYSSQKVLFYSLGNYISNQTTPDYTQLEMMVTIQIIKDSYTGETSLLPPCIEYLWCFKKDEFAPHYTVVPVEDIIGKKYEVTDSSQRSRMERTYRSFLEKGLVKENESLK
jgi:poly-gamma-glutamate synthesis protein (capsule biosynthesis protein)